MDDRFVLPDGEKIRRIRQGQFWSQEQLADRAGLRKRTVERAEAGERLQRSSLRAIAQALGLSPDELVRAGSTFELKQANHQAAASQPSHASSLTAQAPVHDEPVGERGQADLNGAEARLPLAPGRCSNCGVENPLGVKFCTACGCLLGSRCPSCGVENGSGAKFCGSCGVSLTGQSSPLQAQPLLPRSQAPLCYTPVHLAEKILTTKGTLEGERKQVTALFAGLQGSTEWLAERDPEEAQRLLDPFLERMLEAVHRYEGTVNHILGDKVMALFGAPLAHEDHAARACYAALAMQKAISQYSEECRHDRGIDIQLHVGLNSGWVVVRTIRNDLHMEYAAVGQTTYLAAQLEQIAPAGSLWLAGETLRLVEGFVRVKPLEPIRISGIADPVELYELIGAEPTRTRLHAATARVLTPFVGRQHELETLRQALERARTGHGQVVAVIGEPGVGKSRLFYEFIQALAPEGWLILAAGAVSSYGQTTPYLPIIDLLKAYFQVEGLEDERGTDEQVTDKLLALDETLRSTLPAFCTLLDMPIEDPQWQALDPRQRRQRILDAVKRLLLRESQIQPLLVIVENLHWIDTETQALLDSLIESLPTARLLLLVNYRPDYQHRWGNKTYYSQLRLDPLPPARAEELLQALLGRDASLQPLKQRLIERTEGTPFFLEESVWTLAETNALIGERGAYRLAQALPSIQVPATVQAVLAARIDRLAAEEKRLLQAAAVIGRNVLFPLLSAIADGPEEAVHRSLTRLQATEFLYELHLFPEHVYTFKHALTQEVAYQSLLHRARQQYHRQIAQALAERFPDTAATQPELVAHHYTQAGLSAEAATYWQRAGQHAIERSANVEAISHLTKGLELLKMLPENPERIQQELTLQLALGSPLSMVKGHGAPEVEQAFTRARELCRLVGESRQLFLALIGLRRFYVNRAEFETARELGEQSVGLAQRLRDPAFLLQAHSQHLATLFHLGEFPSVLAHLRQGMAYYDPEKRQRYPILGGIDPVVSSLSYAGWALWFLGYPDQALTKSHEALTLARQLSHAYSLGITLHQAAMLHKWRREARLVQELAEEAIALSREHGFIRWLGGGMIRMGWALAEQGAVAEGIAHLQEGLTTWRAMGAKQSLPNILAMLAEAYSMGGRAEEGLCVLAEALAVVQRTTERHYEAELYRLKGELLLQQGREKGGARTIHVGASMRAVSPSAGEPYASPLYAEVENCFLRAIDIARQQSAKSLELRAMMSLSRLWQQQGDHKEARQILAELYGWFTEGFETLDLQEAKALLGALV